VEVFPEFFKPLRYAEPPKVAQIGDSQMQQRVVGSFLCLMMLFVPASAAWAQGAPPAYGMSVGLDNAKKVANAAIAEARKNMFMMAVAVVDTAGNLVYFEKMDGTQTGSVNVAIEKARSAVLFKRPTKAFQDVVAQGGVGLRILGLPGAVPVDGGTPLTEAGKIIGAIGVSGGTSEQDGQCAQAGASVLK
jgi:glc operon protein GlcG